MPEIMLSPEAKFKIFATFRDYVAFFMQIFFVLPLFFSVGVAAQLVLAFRELLLLFKNKNKFQHQKNDQKPQNFNVLITGASAGIGKALAFEYARRASVSKIQLHLVLVARRETRLRQISDDIQKKYPDTKIIIKALDISEHDAVRKFIESVDKELLGGLHVAVANAGINEALLISQGNSMSDEQITREILSVNLEGVINTAYPAIDMFEHHKDQGIAVRRQIIAIASVASTVPNTCAYGISKLAVQEFSRMLRYKLERAGKNIGVTTVCPGVIATELGHSYLESSGFTGKMPVIPVDKAASCIIDAAERNEEIASFPYLQFVALRVFSWLPLATQRALLRLAPASVLTY